MNKISELEKKGNNNSNEIKRARIILHIDMNCFYASCEMAVNEDLRGKPIVVAHVDPLDRGLIVSPSYEARKYGIKATMIVKQARVLCPNLIVCEGNYELYNSYSKLFKEYLLKITPLVEMASCDEAYIDITELNLKEKTIDLAKKIQNDLWSLYKLPCSIGIAPNKFLAKMASDMKKPMGITILRKRDIPQMMWPLDIGDMLFIGKKTTPKLKEHGINTIGDLVKKENKKTIIDNFGLQFYETMIKKAYGKDDSLVTTFYPEQTSVSANHTFMVPIYDIIICYDTLKMLANSISYKMQYDKKKALNVGIVIKTPDGQSFSRSKALENATNNDYNLFQEAKMIFDQYFEETKGIRLIGIFSNRLVDSKEEVKQITIFDDLDEIQKKHEINNLLNSINKQFGKNTIKKGI